MSRPSTEGAVEGVLPGNESELLVELLGVVEAARIKPVKLTRSGIPPKPYWALINERIIWQDPASLLHDWDEADQVRMLFGLAWELGLLILGEDRVLEEGPGAEAFFLAPRAARAGMLLRAYIRMDIWDERCDARDEDGHRYNFGQTFRRDFAWDSDDLRRTLLELLPRSATGEWVPAFELVDCVVAKAPTLLASEEDSGPTSGARARVEVERLVDYWLMLACRLGLVDLARRPGDEPPALRRMFRTTALGAEVLPEGWVGAASRVDERAERRPWIIQPTMDVLFFRHDGDLGDEYLIRRICTDAPAPNWREPTAMYRLDRGRLEHALETGLDPWTVQRMIFDRSREAVPSTVEMLLQDALRASHAVVLQRGITVLEFSVLSDEMRKALEAAGLVVCAPFVLVPPDRWAEFVALHGEEPREAFLYPSEEPLAWLEGETLILEWPILPLAARELLEALEPSGDPLTVKLDESGLKRAEAAGFSRRATAEALSALTGGALPKSLQPYVKK